MKFDCRNSFSADAMTNRQRILDVFEGKSHLSPPVSIRLNLWHKDAAGTGALPEEIRGMSSEEVEDHLGFCRAARHRIKTPLKFSNAPLETCSRGEQTVDKYLFAERPLIRRTVCTQEMKRQGMMGHITEYPLKEEADYDLLLAHMEQACLDIDLDGFDEYDRATGEKGLPLLIAGHSPANLIMLQLAGYENFYYHLADFPQKVTDLISRIETVYRRDLWPVLGKSPARLIMHGCHFSSQTTPPPVFEKFFLSYFQEFNALMHRQGKKVLWHADAEMSALLDHVVQAGFDGADCLATRPLVKTDLRDYFQAWQGRIICWGGLPSIIFDPSFPEDDFISYVEDIKKLTQNRSDFIFGASDHVMPGAPWRRLKLLAHQT